MFLKIWSLKTIDPRKYTKDKYKKIDDTTAGGGPGMIFKPDIMGKAIDACYRNIKSKEKYPLIYLSPRGKPLTQKKVVKLSKMKGINLPNLFPPLQFLSIITLDIFNQFICRSFQSFLLIFLFHS